MTGQKLRNFYAPSVFNAPRPTGVTPSEFRATMFDRMIGLSCGEETDHMLNRFNGIPESEGQTELLYQYRASANKGPFIATQLNSCSS